MKFEIPEKGSLVKTAEDDPLLLHYNFLTGWFYIKRLKMAIKLLDNNKRFDNILEIGFGSGILMPELNKRCNRLFGIDIHENINIVKTRLKGINICAELIKGSILEIPFRDNYFDAIVSVSILEHLIDLRSAVSEIKRVLKVNGVLVIGFPVKNFLADSSIRITGWNLSTTLEERHVSSHRDILSAFEKDMRLENILRYPSFINLDYSLYCACRYVKN